MISSRRCAANSREAQSKSSIDANRMRAAMSAVTRIGISANALKLSGGLERYALDLIRGFNAAGFTGERKPVFFARKIDTSQPESQMVDARRINVSFLPSRLRDTYYNWALKRARKK